MTTPTAEVDEAVGDAIILLVLAVIVLLLFADFVAKHFEAVVVAVATTAVLLVGLYLLGRYFE